MFKKIIIFILFIIVIITIGWYFYTKQGAQDQLEKLKQGYPELVSYIDNVIKWESKLQEDETRVETYSTLGLAWKSLADWAQDAGVDNYKDYYRKALGVYEQAIQVTNRKNTLFMMNAGNMAKYLEDYSRAEAYYKEAIMVAPGDVTYYVLLAELYEYQMDKTKEEVVAVYEKGMKRVINPKFLEKRKEEYLERYLQITNPAEVTE